MDVAPPAWVRKRDGRLEPFDADKISRALFAASESLGRPDAFLARELTDGVVHFLAEEADGAATAAPQIAELVAKVVRELGQPALSAVFAEHGARRERGPRPAPSPPAGASLEEARSAHLREYSLSAVFARDLAAAHADGLLTLTGLEAPGELESCVLGTPVANPAEDGMLAAVERGRRFAGRLVLDGPEYLLTAGRRGDARDLARELTAGLRLAGLRAVVNLNGASPPSWAGDLAGGPLFEGAGATPEQAPPTDVFFHELLEATGTDRRVRIDWHLGERDFRPDAAGRLIEAARRALEGEAIAFVYDRPRRPVALAEGVNRQHPAVLLTVGVDLPRLAEQPGVDGDPEVLLRKLQSLARLALSAGVQKRQFLRRREQSAGGPPVSGGFLLDRARLVVAPVGLDAVVHTFTGSGAAAGGAAQEFGERVVQTLRDVLRRDGALTRLAACVDGPADFFLNRAERTPAAVAGVTPWDASAPAKGQLKAAGSLHAIVEGGTAALFAPAVQEVTPETLAAWLRLGWKQAEVTRVRLLFADAEGRPRSAGRE